MECVFFIIHLFIGIYRYTRKPHLSNSPLLNLFLDTACFSSLCDTYQHAIDLESYLRHLGSVTLTAFLVWSQLCLPGVEPPAHGRGPSSLMPAVSVDIGGCWIFEILGLYFHCFVLYLLDAGLGRCGGNALFCRGFRDSLWRVAMVAGFHSLNVNRLYKVAKGAMTSTPH